MPGSIVKAWARGADGVLAGLEVSPESGLSPAEVERRRRRHGSNLLRRVRRVGAFEILVRQFRSLIVGLLVVAAAVSFAFGETVEGLAIVAVLLINAALGFVAELRAVRSMEALRRLGSVRTRVLRGGEEHEVPADELVPGDVVLLEGGDVVAADLRIVEASKLQADESTLTGESVPVDKGVEAVGEEVELAERASMLFKGTAVTRGSARGVVVATGMDTELGGIARLVEEAEEEVTPLERRLAGLGRRLIWVTLAIAAVATVSGIASGKAVFLMVETGIALAVAAIPEGLPIVATIALGRGMWRMARRNALVNRLSAVETLGATTLILTDKTGTLTENRMTVRRLALAAGDVEVEGEGLEPDGGFRRGGEAVDPAGEPLLRRALEIGVLCNNADLHVEDGEWRGIGDPLEVALLVAGAKAGLEREELLERLPEECEEAFDPETRMMATFHRRDGGWWVGVKGAAEAVLEASTSMAVEGSPPDGAEGERSGVHDGTSGNGANGPGRPLDDDERRAWLRRSEELAADGMRVLAVACRRTDDPDEDPYRELTFVGLIGLLDPPRRDVRDALAACARAGIRVVMVTGDQPGTARNIARAVGLVEDDDAPVVLGRELGGSGADGFPEEQRRELLEVPIFARVDPRHKLVVIALHQQAGEVVAMTGDGVNDAPALKKADIGIAMGRRGTQVAKDAADMVLTDDAFSTIVAAVHHGRVIFANIRKFVVYLLSCNVSEIMVVSGAAVLNVPLPILPLQILFLNLVTDVFPALALAFGEGSPGVLERPPRDPGEPVLARRHWQTILGLGAVITLAVLAALLWALFGLGFEPRRAVTVSFATLALAQLWNVFNMREAGTSLLDNDVVRNPWMWGALTLCAGLVGAAVYLPGLSTVLRTVDPGVDGWTVALGLSLSPLAAGQLWRIVAGARSTPTAR